MSAPRFGHVLRSASVLLLALVGGCSDRAPVEPPPPAVRETGAALTSQACVDAGGEVVSNGFAEGESPCAVSLGPVTGVKCICVCCLKRR